ncbi:helix-turn-helix transcriptional regulator [Streptomyces bullii]|uniref:Helix-turn-helix transcriptional regulator n=1 Tax=Streptomyces bullii TaxID=349910 RepID=A0ABW0UQX5_9ACTN
MIDRERRDADATTRQRTASALAATKPADLKFAELGSFLAARRAEVTPEQVGLPGGGSRRLTGLRREEVAMLAGIGASWYAWIEQGRAKNVSPEILGAIAHVLQLDEAQCLYVMRLAGYAAPRRPRAAAESDQRLHRSIVAGYLPNPAYFIDRYWDITAANSTAVRLLGIDEPHPNYLEMLFLDRRARDRFPMWERDAAEAVARFRSQSGEFLGDPRLAALVGYLRECSPVFADLWERHRISDGSSTSQVLRHPELGQVAFTQVGLDLAVRPGMQLVLLSPQSGGTADRIAHWAREAEPALAAAGLRASA